MKESHKLSDAVHILAYVEIYKNGDLSSTAIANSVESNPSLIRRFMSRLTKAGLLNTEKGKSNPQLALPALDITLLDILNAINDDTNLLHVDPKTNPKCIVGGNIQDTLNGVYKDIQKSAEAKMATITLDQIIKSILVSEEARTRT